MKIGETITIRTGKLDANAASPDGKYPFFTCSTQPLRIDTYSFDCECVLLAGNGDLNVKYYNGRFDAYQRTYVISSKDPVLSNVYLYWFFEYYVKRLRQQSIGGVIKYIKLPMLTGIAHRVPPLGVQKRIVSELELLHKAIEVTNEQLSSLDKQVKSLFNEMFRTVSYPSKTLGEMVNEKMAAIKAGPFGSSLKKEFYVTSGYKIYGQEQVISGDENYGDYYIDEERFQKLKSCKVETGDILISLVGTTGKTLVISPDHKPGIINPRLLKISFNSEVINPVYFQHFFSDPILQQRLSELASHTTMNVLNIGILKQVSIPIPPISAQKAFIERVIQIDRLRFNYQRQIEVLQELMDKRMEEYFGGDAS